MDYTHRAKQTNDIPAPGPATGQYDEAAVRRGARELIAEQKRDEIAQIRSTCADMIEQQAEIISGYTAEIQAQRETIREQAAENARLRGCIIELEREGLNLAGKPQASWAEIADHHNWLEGPRAGQVENFR